MGALACVRSLHSWVSKCGALASPCGERGCRKCCDTRDVSPRTGQRKCFGYLIALFAKNTHSKSALRGACAASAPKRSEVTLNSSRQRIYSVSPHDWAGDKPGKEPHGPCEIRKFPSLIARRLDHRQSVE